MSIPLIRVLIPHHHHLPPFIISIAKPPSLSSSLTEHRTPPPPRIHFVHLLRLITESKKRKHDTGRQDRNIRLVHDVKGDEPRRDEQNRRPRVPVLGATAGDLAVDAPEAVRLERLRLRCRLRPAAARRICRHLRRRRHDRVADPHRR